jgi:hypothetical protein
MIDDELEELKVRAAGCDPLHRLQVFLPWTTVVKEGSNGGDVARNTRSDILAIWIEPFRETNGGNHWILHLSGLVRGIKDVDELSRQVQLHNNLISNYHADRTPGRCAD